MPRWTTAKQRSGPPHSPAGGDEDEDVKDVDAAWAEEIERRVAEIHNGTTPTYAAEDVIAAMRIRFG